MYDFIINYKKKGPIRLLNVVEEDIKTLLEIMVDTKSSGMTKLMNVIKKGHPLTIEQPPKNKDLVIQVVLHE